MQVHGLLPCPLTLSLALSALLLPTSKVETWFLLHDIYFQIPAVSGIP